MQMSNITPEFNFRPKVTIDKDDSKSKNQPTNDKAEEQGNTSSSQKTVAPEIAMDYLANIGSLNMVSTAQPSVAEAMLASGNIKVSPEEEARIEDFISTIDELYDKIYPEVDEILGDSTSNAAKQELAWLTMGSLLNV